MLGGAALFSRFSGEMESVRTESSTGQLVLVTGASGFVGGHCIAELLTNGYDVRATLRNLDAQDELGHLVECAREHGRRLEFVAADLNHDSGWMEAVVGCDAVLHVASPVPLKHEGLAELPLDGMLRVLGACAASRTVRRVVVTSSTDAVTQGHHEDRQFTEAHWSVLPRSNPYSVGKTLAEQAAWRFVEELPEEHRFELVALCPGMILGPIQRPATSISHEPIKRLLNGSIPGSIRVGWAPVDVRDLAEAHRLALETPQAAGQRYICAGGNVWMRDIAAILHKEYGDRWAIPTRELSDRMVRLAAMFDEGMRVTLPTLGRPILVDATKAHDQLGWRMRPVEDSIRDTAASLLQHGIVSPPEPHRRARRLVARGLRPRAAAIVNRAHHHEGAVQRNVEARVRPGGHFRHR